MTCVLRVFTSVCSAFVLRDNKMKVKVVWRLFMCLKAAGMFYI